MISKLKQLQEVLGESTQRFADRFGVHRTTMVELLNGKRRMLPLSVLETYAETLSQLKSKPTTKHPELLIPRELRPELHWVAMHAITHYAYQWSAFENQPAFEVDSGLWTISKNPLEKQVNITNMLVIPYDEAGPALALFHRPEGEWRRYPVEQPVYTENRSSNQPDDLTRIQKPFPQTTLTGLVSRDITRERNRR